MGGSPPYTFSLDNINFQDSPVFTSNSRGDVLSLYVKDANDCLANFTYVVVSNEELSLKKGLQVFPNPARHTLFIKMDPGLSPIHWLSISGMDGRVYKEFSSLRNKEISIEDLPNGLFYLHVVNAEGLASFRFLKVD